MSDFGHERGHGRGADARVESGGAVLVGSITLDDGSGYRLHDHDTHQLAWASSGVLAMGVESRTYVLPPARALWIPAGLSHEVLADGPTRFVSLYFEVVSCPVRYEAPTVVDSSGLLGRLMDYLAGPLDDGARSRAEQVVFDLVEPLATVDLVLPRPTDDRVATIADGLAENPSDDRTLEQWGRAVGASSRTLTRTIKHETGLSFSEWRTRIRVAASLPLLARSMPVARVAGQVGYATPSSFVAAFKRVLGTTPGRYFG